MRWFASLSEKSQEIVQDCIDKMAGRTWNERRHSVDEALEKMCQAVDGDNSNAARQLSTGIIVATVLDRLDAPAVQEAEQAKLYAMSSDFDHQLAACDWLVDQAMDLAVTADPATGETIH